MRRRPREGQARRRWSLDQTEALETLASGHSIIAPEAAEEICRLAGVPFVRDELVQVWRSDPPGTFKGLTMAPGNENTDGVYTLSLSYYVAERLGLGQPGAWARGRGSQARANADAIAVKLGWKSACMTG